MFSEGPDTSKHFLKSLGSLGHENVEFLSAFENLEEMIRKRNKCKDGSLKGEYKIILGFTSNMISCGLREVICYLVRNRLVDAIVTTAGGVEEDLIKCVGGETYLGSFADSGSKLRDLGLNRVGNLLIPSSNYANFEDFITPIFDEVAAEAQPKTPSEFIGLLGKGVNSEESVYSWCSRNSIPAFCPALTDGSIGDMLFFYNFNSTKLSIDVLRDVDLLNRFIGESTHGTGIILLGAGLPKHHILRACRMSKSLADSVVQISTGDLIDSRTGSTDASGITQDARVTTIQADATVVFPLLVSALVATG
ncbi:deoxyhypusine synthase [Perkinsela sp. CCAP 1560/4]|nr:deoxyhypusine synthase [Perkinsela sp. CCAP 1560/4]|eukprot:KNH08744.1 deoxyhypusine synthase [Perkinsela sp. CCAP 1560/4]